MQTWDAASCTRACRPPSTPTPVPERPPRPPGQGRLPPDRRHEPVAALGGLQLGRAPQPRWSPVARVCCDPDPEYGHSVEPHANGKLAWVAYWDSGFIALDLTNPANPVFKGRTSYPAVADGDGHSSNYDEGRKLLFAADEDFGKSCGGDREGLRIPARVRLLVASRAGADRRLQDAERVGEQGRQRRRLHDPQPAAVGHGPVRVLVHGRHPGAGREGPAQRAEVAYFVPPSVNNPIQPSQRGTLTNATQVWAWPSTRPASSCTRAT